MAKNKKSEKLVSNKKLPKIFKKAYSPKKFEKKLLNKLFIESDKQAVQALFSNEKDKRGNEILKVNLKNTIKKEELLKFKTLAKEIKNNGSAIKFIPLLAVLIFIAAICISFVLFKNILIKKAVTSSMQSIFNAKTDIQKVDFQLFNAKLDILGLEQANSDTPMKNLFQIDDIKIDFNLTDLLRGKFHAENIAVDGVALDTERKTSGALPVKKIEKSEEETEKQISKNSEELKNNATKKLLEMFENYNPEKMLSNLQQEFKSPEVSKKISSEVQVKIEKWQAKPKELENEVKTFSDSVNSVINTNWGGINDVAKLKSALQTVEKAMNEGNKLKTEISKTTSEIKVDANSVSQYSNELQTALTADKKLVDTKISEMKALFSPEGLKKIINDAIESVCYEKLGKFYPYIQKGTQKALEIKQNSSKKENTNNSKDKKANNEKSAKKSKERLSGRNVYYKKDTIPSLLIENVSASGYEYGTQNLLFKGTASEITNNQDLRGKPSVIKADFIVLGKANNASIVLDARKHTKEPLVKADYYGKGYEINGDASVFAFNSNSDFSAQFTCDENGSFLIGGNAILNIKEISGMSFEPEKVSKLYNNALKEVKNVSIGFNASYDVSEGLMLELKNPEKLADQFVQPITAALSQEINSISKDAKTNVTKMLSEKTGIASDKISQFTDIQNSVNKSKQKTDNLQKQLENKKNELTKQIKSAGTNAATNALKNLF